MINALNKIHSNMYTSIQKIATGSKHPSANYGSEYAISQRMSSNINSQEQYIKNVQNMNTLSKTASGATEGTLSALTSIKETILNAKNGTNNDNDLNNMKKNIEQSIQQIDENNLIQYNGKNIFGNSFNISSYNDEYLYINDLSSKSLGLNNIDFNDLDSSLDIINNAIDSTNGTLDSITSMGAQQQRFDYQINNLTVMQENEISSLSTLDDTNIAEEVTKLKSNQVQEQFALHAIDLNMHNRYNILKLLGE